MKPLRLTLTAVGPYAGKQVVDFRAALDNRLFGIYGPTGAGKSTIFNAMTYALFGESAKEQQRASLLRSDHSDPALPTEIEFIFESNGRIYRVVRQPEQMRPVKKGLGETKQPQSAYLFDINDIGIDAVSQETPGKIIAEKKADLVNKEIESLLGYGLEQFRQIVLLPQGRFEAFLASNTNERMIILKDLFDVRVFSDLTDNIRAKADEAEDEVKRARATLSGFLSTEGFETSEALSEAILAQEADLLGLQESLTGLKETVASTTLAYQNSAITDRAFSEHARADQALKVIAAEAPIIASCETRLQHARAAVTVLDLEKSLEDAKLTAEKNASHASRAEKVSADADRAAKTAANTMNGLIDKNAEHLLDQDKLRQSEAYAKDLLASASLRDVASKAATKAVDAKAQARRAVDHHEKQTKLFSATTKQLDQERQAAVKRAELSKSEVELSGFLTCAKAYELQQSRIVDDQQRLATLEKAAAKADADLTNAASAFGEAEQALLHDQALYVASHLKDGEPCAACGSVDHPAPAHGVANGSSLNALYLNAKTALDAAQKFAHRAHTDAQSARKLLEQRQAQFAELTKPEHSAADFELQLKRLRNEIAALGPALDLQVLENKKETLEIDLNSALANVQTTETSAIEWDKQAALESQALANAVNGIPIQLQDQDVLSQQIDELQKRISAYVNALEKAREAEKTARETAISLQSALTNAKSNAATAAEQHNKTRSLFAERLTEIGLTAQGFTAAKADGAIISQLEANISDHRIRFARAETRLQTSALAIADVDRPDIQILKDQKDAAEAAEFEANAKANASQARLLYFTNLSDSSAAETARLNRLEQETGPLRELAAAFTGKNDAKMNLETYAILAMFDEVLEAANLRLSPMSNGRYRLVRETDGVGNSRRGLGLAVEDAYTGRPRPTATLSGGETFMAALSLALGLSDVVESRHGNVRLDAIFIDEGFGSLDAEGEGGTLESVLESLQKVVGQNRTVGLISHVPMVQQAIPNGFYIKKTPTGSSVEMRS